MIIGIVCFVAGAALGFGFMYWVSIRMVKMVRSQEEERHQTLINQMNDAVGQWQDIVIDIVDEVKAGSLTNRSIKDQMKVINKYIHE